MAACTPTYTYAHTHTPVPTYKCVLLGDSQCGKTTFVMKVLNGEYIEKYVPTLGVEVHPITIKTSSGPVRFNVWDTAGQEQYAGLGEEYYRGADCAIIMYDVTDESSCLHIEDWDKKILKVRPDIPIVLVGNKKDAVKSGIRDYRSSGYHLYDYNISCKNDDEISIIEPFMWLVEELKNKSV